MSKSNLLADNQTDRVVHLQPNTIFVTNKRIIIRDPSLLGVRESIVSVSYDNNLNRIGKRSFSSKIIRAPGFADEMEVISKKKRQNNSSICEEFNG